MTFSLIGRCPATGQLGAVVTTSDIAVGARVPHALAGVGVAVTQSRTDPRLGPMVLHAIRTGLSPREAVERTIKDHEHRSWRQLGVLDAHGDAAAFTGERAWPVAGAISGSDSLAIGNMLANDDVLGAIAATFAHTPGPLPARLLTSLQAGQQAGGEAAPMRSAALLVVECESFPLVDLRVDAAHDPLTELAALWREYEPWTRAFVARAVDPDHADVDPDYGDDAHRSSSTTT